MKSTSLILNRLGNQQLIGGDRHNVQDLVQSLGVIQAQDYAGAKWALGLRTGIDDIGADGALAEGSIIRTHVLRPTWHFVAPQDIKWMLRLSAPRVNQACAYNYKRMDLDSKIFNKCNAIFEKVLANGRQLDRLEIAEVLAGNSVATDDLRLVHILIRAEIDGIICSGGRKGKQFTYTLLDERLKGIKQLAPAEPLAELALRYFISHGPATLQDYTWWSGLKASDAKIGLEMVKEKLVTEVIDGQEYWMGNTEVSTTNVPEIILLPAFDEYTVAYKDRSHILAPEHTHQARNGISSPVVLLNGIIAGTWQRTIKKTNVEMTVNMFVELNKSDNAALEKAIGKYKKFLIG